MHRLTMKMQEEDEKAHESARRRDASEAVADCRAKSVSVRQAPVCLPSHLRTHGAEAVSSPLTACWDPWWEVQCDTRVPARAW